jgi:hypothetical protein
MGQDAYSRHAEGAVFMGGFGDGFVTGFRRGEVCGWKGAQVILDRSPSPAPDFASLQRFHRIGAEIQRLS